MFILEILKLVGYCIHLLVVVIVSHTNEVWWCFDMTLWGWGAHHIDSNIRKTVMYIIADAFSPFKQCTWTYLKYYHYYQPLGFHCWTKAFLNSNGTLILLLLPCPTNKPFFILSKKLLFFSCLHLLHLSFLWQLFNQLSAPAIIILASLLYVLGITIFGCLIASIKSSFFFSF